MESPDSQEYAFFINNEVKGPFSRTDAEAMIAAKEVGPDTLCAPVGAQDWEPASKFFKFRVEMRLNVKSASGSAGSSSGNLVEGDRPTLDPRLRKKLIQLGLATAATIDELTPIQAEAAVRAYEAEHKKGQKTKIWGGIGAGVGAFIIGVVFGITGIGESFNNWVAGKFVKESPEFAKRHQAISRDLFNVDRAWKELYETELKRPQGREGKPYFDGRVVIPPQASVELLFHADYSKLAELSAEKPRFIYLKQLTSSIRDEMVRQSNLVWKYKHPDTLQDPLNEVELAASWELFKKQVGNTLLNFVKENEQSSVKDMEAADLRIEGPRPDNIVAALEVDGLPVYFPYKAQNYVVFSDAQRHRTTKEEALEAERYTVTEKKSVGGKIYGIRVNFLGRTYFMKRRTPVWYYLGVARQEIDRTPTWIDVSSEEFAQTEIGAVFPTKKLFDYTYFAVPAEVSMTGGLELIQEET